MKKIISFLMTMLIAFSYAPAALADDMTSESATTISSEAGVIYQEENGEIGYRAYSENGDVIPDFSYAGYKHNEAPLPESVVKKTVAPMLGEKSDTGNIITKLKEEILDGDIGDDNYTSIVVQSNSTTVNVLSTGLFWEALDGDNSTAASRWRYNSAAEAGEKSITLDLHTDLSAKPFYTVVVYYYCATAYETPEDSLLGSFRLMVYPEDDLLSSGQEIAYRSIKEKKLTDRIYRYTIDFENSVSARYITMGFETKTPDTYNPHIMEIELYNDDSQIIQRALDEVAQSEPDENGLRGAVMLESGVYNISKPLEIDTSGVVLCGAGDDEAGTILYANDAKQYNAISIGGAQSYTSDENTRTEVTDAYVPVGANSVTVEDASKYSVGDNIVLHVQKNQSWIDILGMGEGGVLDVDGMNIWTVEEYQYHYEKEITAIEGNKIEFDVPIVDALDKNYDLTQVYKISEDNRLSNSGVKDICIESYFDTSITTTTSITGEEVFSDINHLMFGISINNALDCYVTGVTAQHAVMGCVDIGKDAKRITVQNCSFLEGISPIQGGYRYSFAIEGQQCLVRDCYSYKSRHDFVMGQRACGPNVFSNCIAENSFSCSETHQRWSCGVLYDNVEVSGPNGHMAAANRGAAGSGHGWTGTQVVFWNCDTPLIIAMEPPFGQNFVIGAGGDNCTQELTDKLLSNIDWFNNQAGTDFAYEGLFAVGDAHIDVDGSSAQPLSLFESQLAERVGMGAAAYSLCKTESGAVKEISSPEAGDLSIHALVRNTGNKENTYLLIVALKDEDSNTIKKIFKENATIAVQCQEKISVNFELESVENTCICVFLWDGLENLVPVTEKNLFN